MISREALTSKHALPRPKRWPIYVAFLPGVIAAAGILITFSLGYWAWAIVFGSAVFLLSLCICMPLTGEWPAWVGSLGLAALTVLLLAPIDCVSSGPSTECTGIVAVDLPGYSGPAPFSPSYAVPAAIGVVVALVYWVAAHRYVPPCRPDERDAPEV